MSQINKVGASTRYTYTQHKHTREWGRLWHTHSAYVYKFGKQVCLAGCSSHSLARRAPAFSPAQTAPQNDLSSSSGRLWCAHDDNYFSILFGRKSCASRWKLPYWYKRRDYIMHMRHKKKRYRSSLVGWRKGNLKKVRALLGVACARCAWIYCRAPLMHYRPI